MKILVWIGCFLVAAALQVFLGYAGIKGAIPSMAIFLAMCALANYFCKRYEEKRKKQHKILDMMVMTFNVKKFKKLAA